MIQLLEGQAVQALGNRGRNALGLIAMTGSGQIPVVCGRETPLAGHHEFPSDRRKAVEGALGITWPEMGKPSPLTAPELLKRTLEGSPQPVVIVTDGPLTNLGEMFQREPRLAAKVRMIYIMGGTFNAPGNIRGVSLTAPHKTAESSMFVDPHAANIVLRSGAPVTLVPLDASQVPLDGAFYRLLSGHQTTAAARAVYTMLTATHAYEQGGYLSDPVTYIIATDETLATYTTKRVTVVEREGPEVGRTKVTADAPRCAWLRRSTHPASWRPT